MYRDELDALNGIYAEQKRTNELLEQLLNELNKPQSNNRGDNDADTKHENA
ncbi:hypothetical protein [Paenibacillus glucanolyticus]|uniref:hypothetical protein n=1 Tax=Paenibacillus glucanolyticus TaxID=59843 RepID=UPI0030D39A10